MQRQTETSGGVAAFRAGFLIFTVLLALFAAFLSQAAAANYRALFWVVLPFAAADALVAFVYFSSARDWTRWVALSSAILVAAFFGEMTVRICL